MYTIVMATLNHTINGCTLSLKGQPEWHDDLRKRISFANNVNSEAFLAAGLSDYELDRLKVDRQLDLIGFMVEHFTPFLNEETMSEVFGEYWYKWRARFAAYGWGEWSWDAEDEDGLP